MRGILAAGLMALAVSTEAEAARPADSPKPNIVFVLTDDLDSGSLAQLPALKETMTLQGLTFLNNFVSLSLCCPSRSTILRGQYAHSTGVYGNHPPEGGWDKFHQADEASTIATWVHEAGYYTAFMGKYLNAYPGKKEDYVPPGWDEWDVPARGNAYGEYDYTLNENGRMVPHGHEPADYLTDVLAGKAKAVIDKAADDKKPMMLFVWTYAPHGPATPAPRHEGRYGNVKAPRTPSYNEKEIDDKPAWLRGYPSLESKETGRIDRVYRNRLESMLAVEEMLDGLVAELQKSGQLENTYIVFSSDNGFHLGQHRMLPGKNTGYDEDLRVPLIVRGPGVPRAQTTDAISANVDLAATFAELAGAAAPSFVEGRSLVPFLRGQAPSTWRQGLLLEHAGPDSLDESPEPGHEYPDNEPGEGGGGGGGKGGNGHKGTHGVPVFVGVRSRDYAYLEYDTGERELYDLRKDPDELNNIANKAPAALVSSMRGWIDSMKACQGEQCRSREQANPEGAPSAPGR